MDFFPGLEEFGGVEEGVVGAVVDGDAAQVASFKGSDGVEGGLASPCVGGVGGDSDDIPAGAEDLGEGKETGRRPVIVQDDFGLDVSGCAIVCAVEMRWCCQCR